MVQTLEGHCAKNRKVLMVEKAKFSRFEVLCLIFISDVLGRSV